MKQGDFSRSYSQYFHDYQQPHLQNPNPSSNPNDLLPNPSSMSYTSVRPLFSRISAPDYRVYSHLSPTYHSFSPNPNFQSHDPSSQPSSFYSFPSALESQAPYSSPATIQYPSYYPQYDLFPTSPIFAPPPPIPPEPEINLIPRFSALTSSSASYGQLGSSVHSVYEYPYESNLNFDHGGGCFGENYGRCGDLGLYGRSRSNLWSDFCEKRTDDGFGKGMWESYSVRGLADFDYDRLYMSLKDQSSPSKIVKAVPKAEIQQDVKGWVQKFRVKILQEGGAQGAMDVLCQIGLDGIRMLDPSTSRTLRIYPHQTVTRWEIMDSSIFAFWAKSSVDVEPRRIRLLSNSYTTNTILDTVTAATVQLKEIEGIIRPSDSVKIPEQLTEKKKGFADWLNLIKPGNEEKDHWVPDEAVTKCTTCGTDFGAFVRKHHCRNCGDIFCDKCTHGRIALTIDEDAQPVRVCDQCLAEVTQRLSNAKEAASKPAVLHSHEDLARKLQEEMDKNRKASLGSKSDVSEGRTKEVACPTCTVHLQVQVPSSGSETIECGVCRCPFLVSVSGSELQVNIKCIDTSYALD